MAKQFDAGGAKRHSVAMSIPTLRTIPIAVAAPSKPDGARKGMKARAHLKGRQATPTATAAVRALIGPPPARRRWRWGWPGGP
ncbi:hypothetical protein B0E41_01605 [Hydrogenophaga sp. A37]|nr:hypothetical protein B0E41_01605 [Hydrogenophaga sp. A37]